MECESQKKSKEYDEEHLKKTYSALSDDDLMDIYFLREEQKTCSF